MQFIPNDTAETCLLNKEFQCPLIVYVPFEGSEPHRGEEPIALIISAKDSSEGASCQSTDDMPSTVLVEIKVAVVVNGAAKVRYSKTNEATFYTFYAPEH